jgi:hypothetical protein
MYFSIGKSTYACSGTVGNLRKRVARWKSSERRVGECECRVRAKSVTSQT